MEPERKESFEIELDMPRADLINSGVEPEGPAVVSDEAGSSRVGEEGGKLGRCCQIRPFIVGWGVSGLIHVLFIAMLMGQTWSILGGGGKEGEHEFEAGIVVEDTDEGFGAEPGQIAVASLGESMTDDDSQAGPLAEEMFETEAIKEIEMRFQPAAPEPEAIIGMEPEVEDSVRPLEDKWEGFVTVSGNTSKGTASFFGLKARGRKFIYVVDYSGSMNGEKIKAAKMELTRSIGSLNSTRKFFILFYDHKYQSMPGDKLMYATESNKKKYFAWIDKAEGGGGTDPTGAMLQALSLRPDAIWLLSDGLFHENACDVIAKANPGRRVQIHAIAFHDNKGEKQLKRIAEENRGKYRFVEGKKVRSPRRQRRKVRLRSR